MQNALVLLENLLIQKYALHVLTLKENIDRKHSYNILDERMLDIAK